MAIRTQWENLSDPPPDRSSHGRFRDLAKLPMPAWLVMMQPSHECTYMYMYDFACSDDPYACVDNGADEARSLQSSGYI